MTDVGAHRRGAAGAKGLRGLDLQLDYKTSGGSLVKDFYASCLSRACRYDRATGYFRSSALLLVGPEILLLARRGGTIRLLCSPDLSAEDVFAAEGAYETRALAIRESLRQDLISLEAAVEGRDALAILGTLIKLGILDIKIALRPRAWGEYHVKDGVFEDEDRDIVAFRGSNNETRSGWHGSGNFESFDVFASWEGGNDELRARRIRDDFHDLWSGRSDEVEVHSLPDAIRGQLIRFGEDDLGGLTRPPNAERPHGGSRPAMPHQTAAISGWAAQGYRGLLKHATGSGKTFTALLAIKEHASQGLPTIVLVPSRLLLAQWAEEVRRVCPQATVMLAGGGNTTWKKGRRLLAMTRGTAAGSGRITIAVMKTASAGEFLRRTANGEGLLVVGDEAHELGSRQNRQFFSLAAEKRLGLSATPERFGDPEGTAAVFEWFGPIVDPPFTLRDAIRVGRLVPYDYHPHPVHLTAEESDRWREETLRITREMARGPRDQDGRAELTDRVRLLLIQRARIAKKAEAKLTLAVELLLSSFEEGQSWLVYCEDSDQLAEVMAGLRAAGLRPHEFHTAMVGDPKGTLDWCRAHGGILVSIRCLDQGVDIPTLSHALILASSQNPRQFIQRRGRVLRSAGEDKTHAIVHDAIVVPLSIDAEPSQTALMHSEFARALEFSEGARNRSGGAELRRIALDIGVDPASFEATGIEEDVSE